MHIRKQTHAIAILAVALASLVGCASGPRPPENGLGTLWGRLELVPPEGLAPRGPGAGQYGDPRLRDVRRVDYERPGFSVVYLSDRAASVDSYAIEIRSTRTGVRLSPESGVVGVSGSISLTNRTDGPQIVSIPDLAALHRIEPGGTLTFDTLSAGETVLHLLGKSPARSLVFVSPGAYARCSDQGEWLLENQDPGPAQLHAWHHRSPPTEIEIEIVEGETREVKLRSFVSVPATTHSSTVIP